MHQKGLLKHSFLLEKKWRSNSGLSACVRLHLETEFKKASQLEKSRKVVKMIPSQDPHRTRTIVLRSSGTAAMRFPLSQPSASSLNRSVALKPSSQSLFLPATSPDSTLSKQSNAPVLESASFNGVKTSPVKSLPLDRVPPNLGARSLQRRQDHPIVDPATVFRGSPDRRDHFYVLEEPNELLEVVIEVSIWVFSG